MAANPFVHPAYFYRDDRDYALAMTRFLRDGLEAGEPVAVAVPPGNLKLIRAELGADADAVHMLDMTLAGRNPGRIIPAVLRDFADRHPDRHVRIIGEPIWAGRSASEYPACAQHEALINFAFDGRRVTILCPYDAEALTPEVLAEAERTHPVLQGRDRTHAYAPGEVVSGHNRPLDIPAHAVRLRFDRTNLGEVRVLASEQAAGFGFAAARLDDLRLVVTELGANSIDHGGGSGELRVWTEDGRLVCEIADTGHISDPLAGRRPVDPRKAGSRGLLIVNLLSDLVRIHTREGLTTIRTYFDLPLGLLPAGIERADGGAGRPLEAPRP
ncbi:anti-sigma factor RsbA family regulatory protein [Nonomuraea sp. NPDC050310]|uniref:anti-sigma factor RsbA family regulatory protein n=1 Tax=Nonomuraea sp. NPDC050310 TaxID=3154935 RepID=UPI0033C057A3